MDKLLAGGQIPSILQGGSLLAGHAGMTHQLLSGCTNLKSISLQIPFAEFAYSSSETNRPERCVYIQGRSTIHFLGDILA
jgi:hypothetical protein